jgi:hypothetical protein
MIRLLRLNRCAGKAEAAFTLTEVIVITCVMVILSGMGFATLAKQRIKSGRMRCTKRGSNHSLGRFDIAPVRFSY